MSRKAVQHHAYEHIMSEVFRTGEESVLHEIIEYRLSELFTPYALDFQNDIDLETSLRSLQLVKGSDAVKIIKCWVNGWVTSYRFHEEILHNCLLGCSGEPDSLQHYLVCPHCFAFNRFFVPCTSNAPLVRWGLIRPDKVILQTISCTFTAYHALKAAVRRGEINPMQPSNRGNLLRRSWIVYAEAYSAEAGEIGLLVTNFSLPSFLHSIGAEVDSRSNTSCLEIT